MSIVEGFGFITTGSGEKIQVLKEVISLDEEGNEIISYDYDDDATNLKYQEYISSHPSEIKSKLFGLF